MTHAYIEFLIALSIRTAIVLLFLIGGLRLLGKRQIGQINVYDLAMIMAVANAIQNAMTSGAGDLSAGFVCAGTLLLLGRFLTAFILRSPKLADRLVGTPSVIINDGKLIRDHVQLERLTEDQINAVLREHGLTSVDQVRMAVMEVDGTLSIIPKAADGGDGGKKRHS